MAWSDGDYRRAFADGHSRNEYVARMIREQGIWAECPPLRYASSKSEIVNFTVGEKDVITKAGTVEVKGQGKYFTDEVESFPFSTMIVDTVSGWNAKSEKPIAYVFVSIETKHCLAIPGYTRNQWQEKTLFDNKKEIYDDFFVAPKSCLRTMDQLFDFLRKKEIEWKTLAGR